MSKINFDELDIEQGFQQIIVRSETESFVTYVKHNRDPDIEPRIAIEFLKTGRIEDINLENSFLAQVEALDEFIGYFEEGKGMDAAIYLFDR